MSISGEHKEINLTINPTLKERFEGKIIPVTESGCWLWEGALTKGGYGHIWVQYGSPAKRGTGKMTRAHRVSYVLHKGEITKGVLIRHKCDNPLCVNPNHLEEGTVKDNIRDMMKKGRNGYGIRSNLTKEQVVEIRKLYNKKNMTNKQIGDQFGIRGCTVSLIARGLRRTDVKEGL